ncbi:MAG TPA: 7TM diverse intracellular signaling domain-containing protein [Spirochaetota bacterium]|nr:7TM diverse intracellular signaling domain-containing protein [Spirochaetota bacterium]HPI89821.1 7TM diverse intracellular signaling domain-containing protein [Spirochaetota bacterium]HPR49391.1 7TM diverse intracellular signaling domain-containing protein [Spirochaetota bacterium]
MTRLRIVFAALIFCIAIPPLHAGQKPVAINLSREKINLSPHMLYYQDRAGSLSFEDVSQKETVWEPLSAKSVNFGFTRSAYWFKIIVDNQTGDDFPCYIEIPYPIINYIDLYYPGAKGGYEVKQTGNHYPFSHRDVLDTTFIFSISLEQGVSTLYIRIKTSSSLNFVPTLWSPVGYVNRMNREMPLIWIYYGLLIVMAVYHLFLFVSVRESSYICYSLFITFWIFFQMTLLGHSFHYLWPESIWWANNSLPFLMCVTMFWVALYGRSYINTKVNFPLLDKLIVYFGIAPLVLCAIFSLIADYSWTIKIATGITMYYSVGFYTLVLYMAYKGNRQAMFIAIGFAFLALGLVLYVLKTFGVMPSTLFTRHFLQFGISAMVILLSLGMADKINVMKKQLLDLNVNLEKKVLARTEELNTANEELESMNQNLIAVNEELEEAQVIMNRDMAMAINVQRKFFPESPPETGNWQVAFYFRPMSGVSGDLYDFYVSENILLGISLFDVSGHGVASGLITMLAKSILFRNFNEGTGIGLNEVLNKSNTDLINEIGSVGNYLTGIILRFTGDDVEYVNAGHPDLLMRTSGGTVREIKDEKYQSKGPFLGVEVMEKGYGLISFPAKKGDSLLFYTDCLMESTDRKGNEFGIDRIIAAFSDAPAASAAEELDFVMKQFNLYHEKEMISDDLTVILAKKIS